MYRLEAVGFLITKKTRFISVKYIVSYFYESANEKTEFTAMLNDSWSVCAYFRQKTAERKATPSGLLLL